MLGHIACAARQRGANPQAPNRQCQIKTASAAGVIYCSGRRRPIHWQPCL